MIIGRNKISSVLVLLKSGVQCSIDTDERKTEELYHIKRIKESVGVYVGVYVCNKANDGPSRS